MFGVKSDEKGSRAMGMGCVPPGVARVPLVSIVVVIGAFAVQATDHLRAPTATSDESGIT
jgi:hypothetical protein